MRLNWRSPPFMMEDVTFCAWWDEGWHGDTSSPELAMLHGEPWTYATWAAEYYEVPVDVDLVAQIYAGQALTERLVRGLNPELALASLAEDLAETGYPC